MYLNLGNMKYGSKNAYKQLYFWFCVREERKINKTIKDKKRKKNQSSKIVLLHLMEKFFLKDTRYGKVSLQLYLNLLNNHLFNLFIIPTPSSFVLSTTNMICLFLLLLHYLLYPCSYLMAVKKLEIMLTIKYNLLIYCIWK